MRVWVGADVAVTRLKNLKNLEKMFVLYVKNIVIMEAFNFGL